MSLRNIEVWSTWPDATGATFLGVLPTWKDPELTWRTGGEGGFTVKVPRGDAAAAEGTLLKAAADAWALIVPGRVLRIVRETGLWADQRILEKRDGADDEGMAQVTCGGYSTSLAKTPPVTLAISGGRSTFTFDGVGLTAEDQITNYLKPAWDAIGLDHLEVGVIVPTGIITIPYDGDSAWAALQKIEEATDSEASFRADLSTGTVYLDLVPSDGSIRIGGDFEVDSDGNAVLTSGLPTPDSDFGDQLADLTGPRLSFGLNAAISRTLSEVEQKTRLYGIGQNGTTIGEAVWEVADVASDVIELADPAGGDGPILVNDQLNGLYLEADDRTTRVEILDSDADSQTVTVSDDSAFAAGDRVRIRAASDGSRVLYLEDPAEVATHGLIAGTVVRTEIPESVNLIVNADQSTWTGGASVAADGWLAVGSPTLTRTTTSAYRQIGPYSCRVQTTADGEGYATPLVTPKPTAANPYGSGFVSFLLASGAVRVELVATDGVSTFVYPDGVSQKATTTALGVFVEAGVAGAVDLLANGITGIRMRVVQDGPTAADFYVDAAQITESAGQLPLVIGAGPTQLWQAVNAELALSAPTRARYEGRVLDFYRLDAATYPDLKLIGGVLHDVVDPSLGVVEGVRLLEIREKLDDEAATEITLSNLPGDLRSLRERQARPRRRAASSIGKVTAAHAGARVVYDFATTSSDATATSDDADFTSDDVDAVLWVYGAGTGGAILKTTVSSVTNESTIEMGTTALATLTDAVAILGTAAGVLSLAGSMGGAPGTETGNTTDDLWQALIEAQIRELAKRINNTVDTGGGGGSGSGTTHDYGFVDIAVATDIPIAIDETRSIAFSAPAAGMLVRANLSHPSTISIYGDGALTAPEVDGVVVSGATEIIPSLPVVSRDSPRDDFWYMEITRTGGSDGTVGSDDLSVAGFAGGNLSDHAPDAPGDTGWAAWEYASGTYTLGYSIISGGYFGGAFADSTVPALVDTDVPSSASVVAIGGVVYMTSGGDGYAFNDFRLVLSATGDMSDSSFLVVVNANGSGAVSAELKYVDNGGSATSLDSDSGSFTAGGGIVDVGVVVTFTRNAIDDYDVTVVVGDPVLIGDGPSEITIPSPAITLTATGVSTESADHKRVGFYSGTPDAPVGPFHYRYGDGTATVEGTLTVAPLVYLTPP